MWRDVGIDALAIIIYYGSSPQYRRGLRGIASRDSFYCSLYSIISAAEIPINGKQVLRPRRVLILMCMRDKSEIMRCGLATIRSFFLQNSMVFKM